jgi:hypothetical protein
MGASLAQIAIVAALALPLFFLIPRFGSGGIASGYGEGQTLVTGFSETVQLGGVASIKKSQRVVMRVQLDRKPDRWLRWRGVVLDKYDGQTWTLTQYGGRRSGSDQGVVNRNEDAKGLGEFVHVYPAGEQAPDPRSLLEQKIVLEPTGTDVIFAANKPLVLKGPFPSIIRDKYTDAIRVNNVRLGPVGRTAYTVRSDTSVPDERRLRAATDDDYPAEVRQLFLQLPTGMDSRIRQKAQEITREADTAYDKARAIESFLKRNFSYTLDLKPTKTDPLAEFLFDLKEGHCEYFATAMVVMLRSIGIPARIVNGFQMGEYNQISGFYTIRDSDAHSWVEAYFPGPDTWVEFDPTPSSGINDYSQGGLLAQLRQYIDALEVFWLDYIVTLDGEEQASMMAEIQKQLLEFKNQVYGYYKSARRWVRGTISRLLLERQWGVANVLQAVGVLLALAAVSLSVHITLAHRRRRRLAPTGYGPWWHRLLILPLWSRKRVSESQVSAVLFYEQMLAVATRAGLIKRPDQTPVEFAESSGYEEIREITRVYNRVRFGKAPLDEGEADRVKHLLTELKRAVRRNGSRP